MKRDFPSSLCWTVPLIFCVFIVIHVEIGLPQFTYLPETRQIVWHSPPGIIAMGWYGRLVTSALAALILGGALHLMIHNRLHRAGPWIATVVVTISCLVVAFHNASHWFFHH